MLFVNVEDNVEKQVKTPTNLAVSFNGAHRVHKTPITAKSHAYESP